MTEVDIGLVRRKLAVITRNLGDLGAVAGLGLSEYRTDRFRLKGTERLLQELVEAAVEVHLHGLAQRVGVSLIKTSSLSGSEAVNHPAKAVFLLDQVGILAPLYDSADLVFIGGSLVKAGGHNLVEPAVYAKPILFGPNMDNFLEMSKEFRDGHAAVQVRNVEELKQEIERLIHDRARMQALGRAAQALARRHQGATEKNLDTVLSNLESKKGVLSTYEKIIR